MTIQLTPEDEELIQERLRSGAFHSIEEVIHHALRVQEAEESWLVLHKREVGEKLARDGGIRSRRRHSCQSSA